MKNYLCQEAFVLLCIGHLVFVTKAFLLTPSICQDNQNADSFIRGDTQNAVVNFLHVISNKGLFTLNGDTSAQSDGCRRASDEYRHRKGRLYNGHVWTLDCWDPFECNMIEDGILLKLLPVSTRTSAAVRARTVLLPLDQHETSSYTFLPSVTNDNILFATAILSGCSIFVLKPNNINCNLIVIHTNYRCSDQSTSVDYNHLQAMAVLEEVQNTNSHCSYQIYRRWAEDDWRHAIAAAGHDYNSRVFYYHFDRDGPSFFYGSHLGGTHGKWQFCIKVVKSNPQSETCYDI